MVTRPCSILPLLLAGALLTGCSGTDYGRIHGSAPDAATAANDAKYLHGEAERIRGKSPYLRKTYCVLVRCEPLASYVKPEDDVPRVFILGRVVYAPKRAGVSVGDPVRVCIQVLSDSYGPGYKLPESERVSWAILPGGRDWWEKDKAGIWCFNDNIFSLWNAQYLADYEDPLWPEWDRMREIIRKDDGRPVHAPLPFTCPTAQNDDFSPCDDAAAQQRVENALRLSAGKELALAELCADRSFHAVQEEQSILHCLRSGRIIHTTPGAKALLGADVDYHRPADDWSPRKDNVHDIYVEWDRRKAYVVFYGDPANQLQPRFGRSAIRETRWAPGTALEARDLLRYQGDLPAPWAAVRNRIRQEMSRK